jgi:hypothetical protein
MRLALVVISAVALLPVQLRAQIFSAGSENNGQVSVQIDVTLRDATDDYHPVTDYALALVRPSGESVIMRTDETGVLRFAAAAGTYRVKSLTPALWHGRQYSWDVPVAARGGMGIVQLTPANAIAGEVGVATSGASAAPASVQPPQTVVGYKDPRTATLFGVLITGGGQMYAGRTGKGLALLGLGVGSVIAGAAMSSVATCSIVTEADPTGGVPRTSSSCNDGSLGPLYAGLGVAIGSWLYGAVTAGNDARAANATLSARATPMLRTGAHRVGLGLAYSY